MRIWITEGIREFLDEGMPLKVVDKRIIKTAFLREALPGDILILPFEEDYLDFLTEKKRIGLDNPVIFISPEPTLIQENLPAYNSLLIDLKKTGKVNLKNTLSFIFRVFSEATRRPVLSVPKELTKDEPTRDIPEESPENIRRTMEYLMKEQVSLIISFQILEADTPVTVRGSCKIKDIIDNNLLLIRFRPITILKGLREGISIKAVFPAKTSYEGTLNVLRVDEKDALVSIPDRLFIERRRFLRIEPSPERPVLLYIHKHDEPTLPVKVTDISQRGIGFITGRVFNTNEIYPFTIVLPGGEVVASYGVIRYKAVEGQTGGCQDKTFRYGVELFIHPRDEERIAEYVMKREIEIVQLLED